MQLKTVFFGSGSYTIPIIETLKECGLELIITTENESDDKRYENEFYSYLKSQETPFMTTRLHNSEAIEKIKSVGAPIAILASYGAILPDEVINIFPKGILNVHPSLLPKYKGPTPIQTTILNGDTESGTTIIKLDDQVDHGPIVAQETMQLTGTETTRELKQKLFQLGAEMIEDIFDELEEHEHIETREQDHSQEVFTQKIERKDGQIDIANPPDPTQLDRMIRAYYPWPGVWFESRIKNPNSAKASLGKQELRIKLLPNNQIQVEGKKQMSYKDFLNGYKDGKEILNRLSLL